MGYTWAITDFARQAGYAGLFALVLLENLVPPIPSEVVLPFAGWQVAEGAFALVPTLAAATAGSVAGAVVLYALARRGGRRAILATARLSRVTGEDLDRAEARFRRHGALYVLFGRCVPGVRSAVSVPAGMARMPLATFVALTTAGSLVWNAALVGAGVVLGPQFERVGRLLGPASTAIGVGLVVAVVAGVLLLRRRHARSPG